MGCKGIIWCLYCMGIGILKAIVGNLRLCEECLLERLRNKFGRIYMCGNLQELAFSNLAKWCR